MNFIRSTDLVDEQVLGRLVSLEDFESVFGIVGTRIFVANARQIRIAVTHVQLIDTAARQSRTDGTGLRRARITRTGRRTVHGFIADCLSVVIESIKTRNGVIKRRRR